MALRRVQKEGTTRRTKQQERKVRVNITTPQENKKKREKEEENLERKKELERKQQRVGKSVMAGMYQEADPFSPSNSLPSSKD